MSDSQDQADRDWAAQQFAYQQGQDQLNWDWLREQFEYQKAQDALAQMGKGSGGGGGGSSKSSSASQPSGLVVDPVPGVLAGIAGVVANKNKADPVAFFEKAAQQVLNQKEKQNQQLAQLIQQQTKPSTVNNMKDMASRLREAIDTKLKGGKK